MTDGALTVTFTGIFPVLPPLTIRVGMEKSGSNRGKKLDTGLGILFNSHNLAVSGDVCPNGSGAQSHAGRKGGEGKLSLFLCFLSSFDSILIPTTFFRRKET